MNKKRLLTIAGASRKVAIKYLYYSGIGGETGIDAGTNAKTNNLHGGAFTAEAWIKPPAGNSTETRRIIDKGVSSSVGWELNQTTTGLQFRMRLASSTATLATYSFTPDGGWHHVAITWNYSGDKKGRIYFDGILVTTGNTSSGEPAVDDSGYNLYIGRYSGGGSRFKGGMGWVRLTNDVRYTTNFRKPSRYFPEVDASTVLLYYQNEGEGTNINDYSATEQDGTLNLGTGYWVDDFVNP